MVAASDTPSMPDPRLGIGGNNPPADPVFDLRRCRVSCDWIDQGTPDARPGRMQSYWRIYRDGTLVDSFLNKASAEKKLKALRQAAAAL